MQHGLLAPICLQAASKVVSRLLLVYKGLLVHNLFQTLKYGLQVFWGESCGQPFSSIPFLSYFCSIPKVYKDWLSSFKCGSDWPRAKRITLYLFVTDWLWGSRPNSIGPCLSLAPEIGSGVGWSPKSPGLFVRWPQEQASLLPWMFLGKHVIWAVGSHSGTVRGRVLGWRREKKRVKSRNVKNQLLGDMTESWDIPVLNLTIQVFFKAINIPIPKRVFCY